MPAVDDTIVAVSSGWRSAPVGILRLSGPESIDLAERLGAARSPASATGRPCWTAARIEVCPGGTLPATVFWFRAPRSYTGQDVVEIHTVGCLALLRELSARLIELGARRALPGEFTARAYLGGKLDAAQVEGVLALMRSEHEAGVRQAARLARGASRRLLAELRDRLESLLALIEAGIDFVDEEDVRFISGRELVAALDGLLDDIDSADLIGRGSRRAGQPHVALVGPPNAGKSTLFNALIGSERALVSPVLGTTRDVLSAEIELDGLPAVLQDCAGLGRSTDELELATHVATERAAQHADVVLWVHAVDTPWDEGVIEACRRLSASRRILVCAKADLGIGGALADVPVPFSEVVAVSAARGTGLATLRAMLAGRLHELAGLGVESHPDAELRAVAAAIRRARSLAAETPGEVLRPELVSLELRSACEQIRESASAPLDEVLLGRVFAQFCVGK